MEHRSSEPSAAQNGSRSEHLRESAVPETVLVVQERLRRMGLVFEQTGEWIRSRTMAK